MTYSIDQHIHNYSVWTAARAIQTGFKVETTYIREAIEKSKLQEFVKSTEEYSDKLFEKFHRERANKIINHFKSIDVKCSYGRAAKIIAIYLKTSIIVGTSGKDNKCLFIHSPIDSIILENLDTNKKTEEFGQQKWTELEENDYWNLISNLKSKNLPINWMLEEYWHI